MNQARAIWMIILGVVVAGICSFPARPGAVEDKYAKACLLLDKNRFAEALVVYEEILKTDASLEDKKKSRVFNNLGFCYYKLNDLEKARQYYGKALDLDRNYSVCLNNLAVVLMNQKKYEEALLYLDQAYGVEKNIKIIFNLFVTHYYLDHRKEALAYIEEALRLDEAYTQDRLKKKNVSQRDIERLKKYVKG